MLAPKAILKSILLASLHAILAKNRIIIKTLIRDAVAFKHDTLLAHRDSARADHSAADFVDFPVSFADFGGGEAADFAEFRITVPFGFAGDGADFFFLSEGV